MAKGISVPVVQSGLETSIQQGVKNVGQINIPVNIDPSAFKNLSQPLGRVSGLATEFEKSIAASNARVLAFGASVGIINGVQNAFSDLVKTGIEVQKTLADIAAISGQGGKQLSQFGDALFDIGKTTGQSFKTAAQAALEFSRQGLSVEETLKRTNDALTLTRFTSLNAAESVDVLTAAANSFSESGITTAQIINKLVAVDTKFAVSAEDLANGLARAGSIAQEVGVNFDELNAAITVAQERTARGGAVIGNALKTIFTRLRSDETVQALRNIGVESLNAQGQLKGAVPLLQEVAQKIQGLSGGERIQILEAVASKYNINILSALLDDLNNANSKFTQAVGVSAGASNQAYERQIELNKTLAAQINAATVSVTQLFNKLSEIGVTDSLATLLKFVNDLVNGFNNLIDSEGVGGNIAKGLVKGISDVFFTIGLPIIGAIFIKLTKDIAQFGVESLKTILGINQQVRERQALEQAVVNTLIRDQEIMASILALSGNRAKQEEYLLGVYNRQLNALQQVQNIAKSVTPALMAGGLSATTGQIQKRGAGGYLPAQEAADVRRGVGGASASSRVVSIPNFAFGGGKRGTMIANTSEYIVPNFANGGSAIFNKDMVKSYGLPAGAKKISAAGGYVPNFAIINADEKYAALVGQKLSKQGSGNMGFVQRYVKKSGNTNDFEILRNDPSGSLDKIVFPVYGVPEQSQTAASIDETVKNLERMGKNEAFKIAKAITGGEMPEPERIAKDRAGFNPGSLSSFAGSIFEASLGALLGDKAFSDYSSQSVTSAFDFDLTKSNKLKNVFGISENSKYLEVKGSFKEGLMDSVAKKIYQVEGIKTREAISTGKIKLQSPTVGERGKNARAFIDKNGKTWIEIANNQFEEAPIGIDLNRYDTRGKKPANPSAATWGSKVGFIPNFAAGSPLGDAINREMAAGVSPNKIRITQDGRLRNAGNPNGIAVINTRDEPNGKIPNFADLSKKDIKNILGKTPNNAGGSRYTGGDTFDYGVASTTVPAATPTTQTSNKLEVSTGKLMATFATLTIATSTLQQSFSNTDGALGSFGKTLADITRIGAGVSSGALLGGLGKDVIGSRFGRIGSAIGGSLPIIGGVAAGAFEYYKIQQEEKAQRQQMATGKVEESLQQQFQLATAGKEPEEIAKIREEMLSSTNDQLSSLQDQRQCLQDNLDLLKSSTGILSRNAAYDGEVAYLKQQILDLESQISDENDRSMFLTQAQAQAEREAQVQAKIKATQDKKTNDEIVQRIALITQLNSLNEALAIGENKVIEERAKKQSDFIKNSYLLTDIQKKAKEDEFKLLEIDQKRDDLRRSTLLGAVTDLSKGKLTTGEKEAVDQLRKRLQAGEDIKNVEEEIRKLNIQGNSEAKALVENLMSQWRIKNGQLDSEKSMTKERQDAIRQNETLLAIDELRFKTLKESFRASKDLEETQISGQRAIEEARSRTPLALLENQIATQPFATKEQEYNLIKLRSEFEKLSAIRKIDEGYADSQRRAFNELQSSIINNIESSKELGKQFIEENVKAAQGAKGIAGLSAVLEELRVKRSEMLTRGISEDEFVKLQQVESGIQNIEESFKKYNITAEQAKILQEELTKQTQKYISYQVQLAELRKNNPLSAGILSATNDLRQELENFDEKFGRDMTLGFRDGLRDAMGAAISQTDDLNSALQNVAMNFLKSMQSAFLNKAATNVTVGIGNALGFAKGGLVSGGSGYRDDVPAMLTGGEFVMRKSAVQKYGAANLAKMNSGGIFLPGVRGGGAISGYDALRAFANQTTTSGATDILRGGSSSAFINLEDQSSRLSRFALLGDDTINQEIRSAQEQGLNIIAQREAYRTQQRKAFQQQLVGTIASAALSAGIGKLMTPAAKGLSKLPISYGASANPASYGPMAFGPFTAAGKGMFKAYGGAVRRYASGGPTDDIPALLMSGEYVMNRGATSKYGKRLLDSMNQGRTPRFADGGEVGVSTTTTESNAKMMGDVSININVTGQNSQTETQGNTSQGGIDYKKMSERIKAVVLETINEEKRLGGALRTR